MKKLALLLLVLSFGALAAGRNRIYGQGNSGSGGAGSVGPDAISTSGDAGYFVDSVYGSDSNDCSTAQTACATHQAVLNRMAKNLRYGVTITAAGGADGGQVNYPCFAVAGFTGAYGEQQASAGLLFDGPLIPPYLDGGTTSGTATGGSAGVGNPFWGVLNDSTQAWYPNALQGMLVTETVSGVPTTRVISSNTPTSLITVGTWTNPNGNPYAIQIPGWNINTACTLPAAANAVAGANSAAVLIYDNQMNWRTGAITLRNVGFSNAAGGGVSVGDNSGVTLQNFSIRNLAGIGITALPNTLARLTAQSGSFTGSSTAVSLGSHTGNGALNVNNCLSFGSNAGLIAIGGSSGGPVVSVIGSEALNATQAGIRITASSGGSGTTQTSHLDCASSAGFGVYIGGGGNVLTTFTNSANQATARFTSMVIGPNCGVGYHVQGPSVLVVDTTAGSAATTGFQSNFGGRIHIVAQTMDAGTQLMSLDNGGSVIYGTNDLDGCNILDAGSSKYGSRICK